MKLQINKGQVVLLANPDNSDINTVKNVADRMGMIEDCLVPVDEGCEDEYYLTMGYDHRFTTVAEIKEAYKTAKSEELAWLL